MSKSINVTVGGASTLVNGIYTGIIYDIASNTEVVGSVHNNVLTVEGALATTASPNNVTITFTLDTSVFGTTVFESVHFTAAPTNATAPTPTITNTTITIVDPDMIKGDYNFIINFKNASGIYTGQSQDPTIYNSGST